MDGDFAPMLELVELRKKHGFLLVIDDVSLTRSSNRCSLVIYETRILISVMFFRLMQHLYVVRTVVESQKSIGVRMILIYA